MRGAASASNPIAGRNRLNTAAITWARRPGHGPWPRPDGCRASRQSASIRQAHDVLDQQLAGEDARPADRAPPDTRPTSRSSCTVPDSVRASTRMVWPVRTPLPTDGGIVRFAITCSMAPLSTIDAIIVVRGVTARVEGGRRQDHDRREERPGGANDPAGERRALHQLAARQRGPVRASRDARRRRAGRRRTSRSSSAGCRGFRSRPGR